MHQTTTRRPVGEPPGGHPDRPGTGPYAPTAIDRTLDRVHQAAPAVTRLSDGLVIVAIAIFGVMDLLTAGSLSFSRTITSGIWILGTVALVVVALFAVAVRRAHLVLGMSLLCGASLGLTAVSVVIGTPLTPSFAVLFAAALLSARAVRLEPAGPALASAAAGACAVAAEAMRPMAPLSFALVAACEVCFAVALAGGAYLRWVDWRRVVAADAARQDERLEIARELHDLVGHYVTGIVVQAQAARHVADQNPGAAISALEQIEVAGGQAMASMRRMVGGLREDSPTAPGASWDDIRLAVGAAAADGVPVRLQIAPEALTGSADLAMSAHRIVGESLTNVRRHAREVTRVDVQIGTGHGADPGGPRPDRLIVSVTDDGLPAPSPAHDTYGLVGMHERAEALGGTLYAGPGPAGGWLVRAELPFGTS